MCVAGFVPATVAAVVVDVVFATAGGRTACLSLEV
jgi:hypothetical protein